MNRALALNSACLVALSCALAAPAWAQDATSGPGSAGAVSASPNTSQVQEVIVTANKRNENMQNVPLNVTAISPSTAVAYNITSTANLEAAVPGLNYQVANGFAEPHLRGVGLVSVNPGDENSVATYVDGVYIASFTSSMQSLNNVQDIEVDKGPQGTLFGRNATGGVIAVTTKNPSDQFHFIGSVGYGSYDDFTTSDYITGGIAPNLAADLAVYYEDQRQGFGRDITNGLQVDKQSNLALRSKWRWTPDDSNEVILSFDYEKTLASNLGYQPTPGTFTEFGGTNPLAPFGGPFSNAGLGSYNVALPPNINPHTTDDQGGVALTIRHDFGFAELTSISAYRQESVYSEFSAYPAPTPVEAVQYIRPDWQFSQELQIGSHKDSTVQWIAGAYYFEDRSSQAPFLVYGPLVDLALGPIFSGGATPPGLPLTLDTSTGQQTRSEAVYGQFTVPVPALGNTNITAGARYTSEQRTAFGQSTLICGDPYYPGGRPPYAPGPLACGQEGAFVGQVFSPFASTPGHPVPDNYADLPSEDKSKTFDKMTFRLSIDHHITSDFMVYASYNTGFKSGGFNVSSPGTLPYEPETLTSDEIGFKSELFDRRLRLNGSAFYYQYDNIQQTFFQTVPAPGIVTINAKGAVLGGIDLDLQAAVTDNLTISGGVEYMGDKFTDFPNAQGFAPVPAALGGGISQTTFNAKDKMLPWAPTLTANLAATYKLPTAIGPLDFTLSYYHNSGAYATANDNPVIAEPAYDLVNFIAGWTSRDARYRVSVYVNNLTDARYDAQFSPPSGNPSGWSDAIRAAPRTAGIVAKVQY
jgi:iron complex outermembrane recepter protein